MTVLNGSHKVLRVFVGETDTWKHRPFYEAVLYQAREQGLAGCTVLKGVMSYGASRLLHTSKLLDISQDMPMVIELIDEEVKIRAFAAQVNEMFEEAGCGGIVTIEAAEVMVYKSRKDHRAKL